MTVEMYRPFSREIDTDQPNLYNKTYERARKNSFQ